jgi:hypothetical protein
MKRNKGTGILALIFGTIIGAIAAIFFGTDDKGDTKKKVKTEVGKAKKKVKELDKKKIIDSVSKKIDKSSAEFKKAKANLTKKLDEAKKKLDTVDKSKYQNIVADVLKDLKKTSKATGAQLSQIKDLLVDDYNKLAPKKKTKKTAKKK